MTKKFAIYPRTKGAQMHGLQTEQGHVAFGNKTVINTGNEKIASEIREKYPHEAMVVHDEQLSKATDSGSWDVIEGKRGPVVKTIHNYTFGASESFSKAWQDFEERRDRKRKPEPKNKFKEFLVRHRLTQVLWFWDLEEEIGVRILGVELRKKKKKKKSY